MNIKKLPSVYRKIKIIKSEYYKGIPRYDFNIIPKELEVKPDSVGLVLYADDEIKVGKISKVKFPYVEVLSEKDPTYRPLILLNTQVILLDPGIKLYKLKLKKFDRLCARG